MADHVRPALPGAPSAARMSAREGRATEARENPLPDERVADLRVADLRVAALLAATPHDAEHLLPLLLAVQEALGHVPPHAIPAIAEAFNRSRSEVYAVVTFYKDLRTAPVGRTVVQLCMAEACQAVGGRALAAHAEARLGVRLDGTTADGRAHLEATYCLGNCALGPAVRIGDAVHGLVTPERLDALLDAVPPGRTPALDAAR